MDGRHGDLLRIHGDGASTFINQAQSGANFGNSLLMGGQSDAANNAGTTEMQGFAGMSPTGGQTQASSYYLSNNVGMTQAMPSIRLIAPTPR
ncbi:conjugal transfer protein TraN, putative [Acidithiobacillus sp. GGI-221]|nr:conjugal transfer protein TraN, putative [Acidithiobacillus sp. GGI-221]